jgi:hypothetical protein
VIIGGAFAISGHTSGNGTPKVHPQGGITVPEPGISPSAAPSSAKPSARPTPMVTDTEVPSAVPTVSPTSISVSPTHAVAPVGSPSPVTPTMSSTPIPPGVLGTFSYQTSGYEQTSIPGTKRTYPSTTTITNTKQGCGVLSTWKPVPQHVQSQELCASGSSLRVASYQTTISFFGINTGESFTCPANAYIYRPNAAAGQVWRYRCKSADAMASQVAHVIGYSTMTVGGKSLRVLHVQVDTTLTGSDAGKSTQDYWIATNKPVLAKETGTVDATQDSVHYDESYSLTLESVTPKV